MDLKGILAISGYSDLFKMVKQGKSNIIVESLKTGQRMPAYSSHKISALEDISMYTGDEDIKLAEVFRNIFKKENGGTAIDPKEKPEALKKYFEEVLPAYDKDRVYLSDIKRVYLWYNQLQALNMVDLEIPAENSVEEKPEVSTEE
ncbi:MAG TPA: hypothetical protein DCQ31_05125 [Bacteroidales bacterium]|nr:hypothetical protein [Bacteroidales bacterium]